MRSRQRLERAPALDEDPQASRLRDAGNECDRRRQDERAGRRRDKHGEGADEIAREIPRNESNDAGEWQEGERIFVGEPTKGARAVCAAVTIRTMPE